MFNKIEKHIYIPNICVIRTGIMIMLFNIILVISTIPISEMISTGTVYIRACARLRPPVTFRRGGARASPPDTFLNSSIYKISCALKIYAIIKRNGSAHPSAYNYIYMRTTGPGKYSRAMRPLALLQHRRPRATLYQMSVYRQIRERSICAFTGYNIVKSL